MRKTFVWALVAMMAVAGSAFAQTVPGGAPATLANDDSCDISVAPAATLLLPYFEVDIDSPAGVGDTTLFTVTNVSPLPQVAHVTVWTDLSAPVLDFNIFLTGYDVQAINLYDVIARGLIAPDNGTSSARTPGDRSAPNNANPNLTIADCNRLAVSIPPFLQEDIRTALTEGELDCGTVGNEQADGLARGYVTIDLASSCNIALPTDEFYAERHLLFDNVLIGDYQQVDPENNFAQGGPMVHLRAIPEGGPAGAFATDFERTFYSRYQEGGTTFDRRQPLPATFAARWIDGGATGFETSYKVWREGVTGMGITCGDDIALNDRLAIPEIVRFDEDENPFSNPDGPIISPTPPGAPGATLPEASRTDVGNDDVFPPNAGGDVAGWMYLNLHHGSPAEADGDLVATQNWVIVSMEAEGRFSVDFDAAWLGNGCSAPVAVPTEEEWDGVGDPIQPVGNDFDADNLDNL